MTKVPVSALKPALTYEQQIIRLVQVHNLSIVNPDSAKKILAKVNYYRLSAYGIGLKKEDDPERYQNGVTLDHIFRLYCFDSQFRNNIIHTVEQIEIQLRSQIAYQLAIQYGPDGYMDVNNFDDKKNSRGISVHECLIEHFQDEVRRNKTLPFVKHHVETYGGRFPIWAAVELMTFGNISSFYSIMKPCDRKKISELYDTIPNRLESWMLALVEIRNICAHYDRLYNMPLKQIPFLYRENIKYRTQPNKMFPVLLVIKRMRHANEQWESFLRDITGTIEKYDDIINFSFMGFPEDWEPVLRAPLRKK